MNSKAFLALKTLQEIAAVSKSELPSFAAVIAVLNRQPHHHFSVFYQLLDQPMKGCSWH